MMRGSSLVVGTAALVVAVGLGLGGYAVTTNALGRDIATTPLSGTGAKATPAPTPSALASALATPAQAPAADAPPASPAEVALALSKRLASPALGATVLAQVSDASTGQVLYRRGAATAAAPASTAKLATAVAVLSVHASTDRITTTVVAGARAGQVVLVGAGDPTLSGAAAGKPSAYADAARISDLAAQLQAAHVAVTTIVVDGRVFSGPATAPGWLADDTPTDYAAPITALMADGGRANPSAYIRSAAPDLAAGAELAAVLGLPASRVARGAAPVHPKVLAKVQSATYGELVEQMLLNSDNVIAECLGRQVAISQHRPASFAGAVAAIRAVLATQRVAIGAGMSDASGLAGSDRLSPAALVAIVALATAKANLRAVIDDLPVAGWDGTLSGRFTTGVARVGAGLVRAKTGTLTSVSTLAGIVTTANGRVLVFAFIAPAVGASTAATQAAEAALDAAAAALVAS